MARPSRQRMITALMPSGAGLGLGKMISFAGRASWIGVSASFARSVASSSSLPRIFWRSLFASSSCLRICASASSLSFNSSSSASRLPSWFASRFSTLALKSSSSFFSLRSSFSASTSSSCSLSALRRSSRPWRSLISSANSACASSISSGLTVLDVAIRFTASPTPSWVTVSIITRIPTTLVIVSNSESRLAPLAFFGRRIDLSSQAARGRPRSGKGAGWVEVPRPTPNRHRLMSNTWVSYLDPLYELL